MTAGGEDRHPLVGRDVELRALYGALTHARQGRAQVVVVEGEPGIGKSALLGTFVQGARLTGVRWLRCDEFAAGHAYGAADRLVGGEPLSGRSPVAAGRRVLGWFGERQDEEADVAVLVVDDAQWLDQASANALQFAVRRLRADRVLILVGRRAVPLRWATSRPTTPRPRRCCGPLDSTAHRYAHWRAASAAGTSGQSWETRW